MEHLESHIKHPEPLRSTEDPTRATPNPTEEPPDPHIQQPNKSPPTPQQSLSPPPPNPFLSLFPPPVAFGVSSQEEKPHSPMGEWGALKPPGCCPPVTHRADGPGVPWGCAVRPLPLFLMGFSPRGPFSLWGFSTAPSPWNSPSRCPKLCGIHSNGDPQPHNPKSRPRSPPSLGDTPTP